MTSFRCLFLGALGACVVLAGVAIALSQYADFKERAANATMYAESEPLRQSIETRIRGLGTIENSGFGIKVPVDAGYKAVVTRDGTVILQGLRYGHMMVLTPSLVQGAVSWQCIGGPYKDMPYQCRAE